jgi:hypothetical protein
MVARASVYMNGEVIGAKSCSRVIGGDILIE